MVLLSYIFFLVPSLPISIVAQGKRARLITWMTLDRNQAMLLSFFYRFDDTANLTAGRYLMHITHIIFNVSHSNTCNDRMKLPN